MITDSERTMLSELRADEYTDEILLLVLSRYHRINAEAKQFDKDLGPADFVALIDEVHIDLSNRGDIGLNS